MTRVCLVTANVGSVFENIDTGLRIWIHELILKIQNENPDFVALHFQETGGKYYKTCSLAIEKFFGSLMKEFSLNGYNLLEGIVDSDSEVEHEFTAMSSLYFLKRSCKLDVKLWNFVERCFVPLNPLAGAGKLFIGKELRSIQRAQKEKFPIHFFPNSKWSRKGFARTRWRFGDVTFDLVNIHLFHDASNIEAASSFPSTFSQTRQRALAFTLEKFQIDDLEKVPMFIFGDFNFRINTFQLLKVFDEDLSEQSDTSKFNCSLDGKIMDSRDALVIDHKLFSTPNHEEIFKDDWKWLKPYDFEVSQFNSLHELEIEFHPTYPFDEEDAGKFMKTRCPSWCDRVLFTSEAKQLIAKEPAAEYNLIGGNVCMGDHKPVFLSFTVESKDESTTDQKLNTQEKNIHSFESGTGIITNANEIELGTERNNDELEELKSRERFVTFLRENLSFSNESSKNHKKSSNLGTSSSNITSTMISSTNNTSKSICCFRRSRNTAGRNIVGKELDQYSKTLSSGNNCQSNAIIARTKQNLLLSKEVNPLVGGIVDNVNCPKDTQVDSESKSLKLVSRRSTSFNSTDAERIDASNCCSII